MNPSLVSEDVAPASSITLATLAQQLGEQLAHAGVTLVTAESCTGGMIAAAVTEIAGSSGWFERGYVTYSNEAKSTSIGVSAALIAEQGAVSEAVAAAMAQGALAASSATVALSVTGIAGPGGGSPEKPVGTVCFGWYRADRPVITETCHFQGDRSAVRLQSAQHAMRGIAQHLL